MKPTTVFLVFSTLFLSNAFAQKQKAYPPVRVSRTGKAKSRGIK
jgi:hypothetical protein